VTDALVASLSAKRQQPERRRQVNRLEELRTNHAPMKTTTPAPAGLPETRYAPSRVAPSVRASVAPRRRRVRFADSHLSTVDETM
jgi:hypothetical protein